MVWGNTLQTMFINLVSTLNATELTCVILLRDDTFLF